MLSDSGTWHGSRSINAAARLGIGRCEVLRTLPVAAVAAGSSGSIVLVSLKQPLRPEGRGAV